MEWIITLIILLTVNILAICLYFGFELNKYIKERETMEVGKRMKKMSNKKLDEVLAKVLLVVVVISIIAVSSAIVWRLIEWILTF